MTPVELSDVAFELAESWANGNHKYVIELIQKSPSKFKAAILALAIHEALLDDGNEQGAVDLYHRLLSEAGIH